MLHILLAEDLSGDVLMVREAIRHSPVEADVTVAYDGEEAVRLLDGGFTPDFIILDLNIPKFNGLRLLERYRGQEGPPVIVFTASENPGDRDRALALGAKEYLIKPMSVDQYIGVIRGALRRWIQGKKSATSA